MGFSLFRDLTFSQAERDREERELARQELHAIQQMEMRGDYGDKTLPEWKEYVRSVWEKAYGGPEPIRPKGEPLPTPEELEEAEFQARRNRYRASPEMIWRNEREDERRAQDVRDRNLAQLRWAEQQERGFGEYHINPIG